MDVVPKIQSQNKQRLLEEAALIALKRRIGQHRQEEQNRWAKMVRAHENRLMEITLMDLNRAYTSQSVSGVQILRVLNDFCTEWKLSHPSGIAMLEFFPHLSRLIEENSGRIYKKQVAW